MTEDPPAPRSFVEKLNHLFDTVRDPHGEAYSPEFVSGWLRTNAGPRMSTSYLYMLRRGERDNPTKAHIEALARFFGVPPGYFFDDEITERIDKQLEVVAAIRTNGVSEIAMRSAALNDDARRILTDLLGSLEGSSPSSGRRRTAENTPQPSTEGAPQPSAEGAPEGDE